MRKLSLIPLVGLLTPLAIVGCGQGNGTSGGGDGLGGGSSQGGGNITFTTSNTGGASNSTSTGFIATSSSSTGSGMTGDPTTCDDAAMYKTYIGCDFYPTVTANSVWSNFDFAAVVANAGDADATVTVTRNGATVATETVKAGGLTTVYLPWVTDLKGGDGSACGEPPLFTSTVRDAHGAYHLVSTVPVTVYQFSALEYQPKGGPPGKNWGSSGGPGASCTDEFGDPTPVPYFSYTNDASLLLPSTALTGNYRVTGYPSWNIPAAGLALGSIVAVTGVEDNTTVTVSLTGQATIVAGGGVTKTSGGGKATFTINQGEVVELVADVSTNPNSDFTGSLIQGDKPIQVIHSVPCIDIPTGVQACDHIEQIVFPAETLGKHYVVTVPTGPNGDTPGHIVRIVGNVNGTHLTYPSGVTPAGAPSTINAGQVVQLAVSQSCGSFLDQNTFETVTVNCTNQDFEVEGDHEFSVATFQLGGEFVDQATGNGDPSESLSTAVEQYRTKYIFLAPGDYPISYADVVRPKGTTLTLDGAPVGTAAKAIGSSDFEVVRIKLAAGGPGTGAHVLTSTNPVGLQVSGYGSYTSYQYPGGLNLSVIAPPPPPPQ